MPAITLTWNAGIFVPYDDQPYGDGNLIYVLEMRNQDNGELPAKPGVYIIENGRDPIYAGEAQNIRSRFDKRAQVLREFGLVPTLALRDRTVRYATVNPANQRALAEQWLVRTLYLADQEADPHVLQNVELTGQLLAPEDGLTITNAGTRPSYLNADYTYDGDEEI